MLQHMTCPYDIVSLGWREVWKVPHKYPVWFSLDNIDEIHLKPVLSEKMRMNSVPATNVKHMYIFRMTGIHFQ